MADQRDLAALLRTLRPELKRGQYVFCTLTEVPAPVQPVATIREDEGLSVILDRDQADALTVPYDFVAAMITLRVVSALDAIGLTAAVAQALTGADIPCNVVAGHFHDHLFVPAERAADAMDVLEQVAAEASRLR